LALSWSFILFFSSNKVIGLDIGSSTIKVAELDVGRGGAELISFGFAPTPANSVSGGDITAPDMISHTVKKLIADAKCKRKMVSVGMFGTAVIVKKISIPRVEKKLIHDQMKFEAEQYIPFELSNICLAYHIVNPEGYSDTMEVILVAAQNDLVFQYTNVVLGAKLDLAVLDVSGFALANLFELNYGKFPHQNTAIINIGANVTNLVIISDDQIGFCRDIPTGGATYTNEIHKEMGISIPEAESLKISAVTKQDVPEQVHSIISATNDLVTEDIRNSIDFFVNSQQGGSQVTKCYFTGGSCVIPGLVQNISAATNMQLEPLNPFLRVKAKSSVFNDHYLQQIARFCPVVFGLGLRTKGDN
jgi:type IV pilus assembly protein PilM